ncbi:MAG: hypothetical protein RLZZ410_1042 [Pseudomonadota bacterium]|jgi:hypothetical protein
MMPFLIGRLLGQDQINSYELIYKVGDCYATFQVPDLPPLFSSSLTSLITMPRSTALHMS